MRSDELFTGERFVPGIQDNKLEIEHFQRYLSVRKLVKGKCVLDAACGEGYGSNILAETAKEVIAIDIDEEAVSRARERYENKDNLCFKQGNIEKLDLLDQSIDVVVSFETIEHVYEETQNKFLSEINRVLKPDGILIMSTPNKAVYSDMHNYKNKFHMKEFYHDEFISFLRRKFQYVQLYNQTFRVFSVIDSCDRSDEIIDYYSREKVYNDEGKYYIAIASHYKLDKLPLASLYVDNLNEYEENINRILSLQEEEETRNAHIKKLDVELEKREGIIRELQQENNDRNIHIKELDAELKKNGNIIQELREENEERNCHIRELDDELKKSGNIIRELQEGNEERNRHVKELDDELKNSGYTLRELQRENDDRNRHIQYLDSIIAQNNHMMLDYRTEIDIKNQQLEAQKRLNDTQLQQIVKQSEQIVKQTEQMLKQADDVDRYAQQSIKKSEQIERQGEENAEQKKVIEQQDKAIFDYKQRIAELKQTAKLEKNDYEQRIAELEQAVSIEKNSYEQRITELEQTTQREKGNFEQRIADLEQTVRNKEGHIEQLLEVERTYEHEKKTHSYKMGKRFQKLGDFLLPPNSRRRFFARVIFNIFRHPIVMLHVINPTRIKNYFKYIKNGDMEGIKRGFEEAVRTEKMGLDGNEVSEVHIMPVADSGIKELRVEDFEKITFQTFRKPTVSIVIPVYNEFNYTYNCLMSILKNSGDVAYEVIIANDCSTDLTKNITDIVSGIKVITTKKNLRFLLNCNNAARHAKGKYILFLNNDTQVQENWLHPLVQLIESDERIGMVGSKLIYPDGYLQEAGGILWRDGSAWNYGNRKNPDDSEYNYVKEADYISGAAIMIKKSLWNEIGGFDERFAPAYCEDSDLAFSVRTHGYKVMYQPLSVVVHFEGVSNGTDTSSGQKAYQIVNQQRFMEKWKDVLEKEHFPNAENVFVARDRNRHKPVLLMVDHYVPQYDKDAGSRTVFQYLKMFVDKGYNVKFIGDNFYRHEPYTTTLQQMGIEVLYGPYYAQHWKEWIKENGDYVQYAFLNRPHISVNYIDFVRENTKAEIIYYGHDLHFLREMRKYDLTHDKQALIDSNDWKEKEFSLMRKADVVYYPSNIETDEINKIDANIRAKAIVAYIFENVEAKPYHFDKRKDLMFVGGFTHTPNVDAVIWFGEEVMPKIIKEIPDIKWYIMGSNPPQKVVEMANNNIIVKGFVSDEELEKYYYQCRMSIVPLRYGAGIKGKVVEAMRYGIPVVTTSVGAEGITGAEDILCIADDADALAREIITNYNNKECLKQISAKSYEYIKNNFSQENAWNVVKSDFL